MSIFKEKTESLITALGIDYNNSHIAYDILELGAGDGSKTQHLLKRMLDLRINFNYHAGDISQNSLNMLQKKLESKLPALTVVKHQGQYIDIIEKFNERREKQYKNDNENRIINRKTIVLFLGSSIGNMLEKVSTKTSFIICLENIF